MSSNEPSEYEPTVQIIVAATGHQTATMTLSAKSNQAIATIINRCELEPNSASVLATIIAALDALEDRWT